MCNYDTTTAQTSSEAGYPLPTSTSQKQATLCYPHMSTTPLPPGYPLQKQGFSETRQNTKGDVAITLTGCNLFCVTLCNLDQSNVQDLQLCVEGSM